jgi:response regulator RpfG family c-di-GMP phosphodiesterase
MLSAKNEQENKFKGIDLGADDYITKPFDPTELEERIDSILFSDNNKDFNSITGLPNKAAMKKYIDEKKETRTVLEIKIKNQDVFREKFGVNNVEKVLKLISRLLKDKVKDDLSSEVFHVEDNKFAIFSKISNLSEEISQSFSYLIPFIYHNKNPDEKLELEFKEVKITR